MYRTRRTDRAGCGAVSREKTMKRTVQEIAHYIGGNVRGDGLATLDSIASLKNARPTDLSYAEEKFYHDIAGSAAGCVIVQSEAIPARTLILANNPKLAFARAAA